MRVQGKTSNAIKEHDEMAEEGQGVKKKEGKKKKRKESETKRPRVFSNLRLISKDDPNAGCSENMRAAHFDSGADTGCFPQQCLTLLLQYQLWRSKLGWAGLGSKTVPALSDQRSSRPEWGTRSFNIHLFP